MQTTRTTTVHRSAASRRSTTGRRCTAGCRRTTGAVALGSTTRYTLCAARGVCTCAPPTAHAALARCTTLSRRCAVATWCRRALLAAGRVVGDTRTTRRDTCAAVARCTRPGRVRRAAGRPSTPSTRLSAVTARCAPCAPAAPTSSAAGLRRTRGQGRCDVAGGYTPAGRTGRLAAVAGGCTTAAQTRAVTTYCASQPAPPGRVAVTMCTTTRHTSVAVGYSPSEPRRRSAAVASPSTTMARTSAAAVQW